MTNGDPLEKLLWSIALPGFGQFLNQKYFKGFVLVGLEFLVNSNANLNNIIISSFHGNTSAAIQQTDFHWLMFYPCLYMFGIWDAYHDAGGGQAPLSFLPFIAAAFLGTVGLIYSTDVCVLGYLLGPVWSTMLFAFIGLAVGALIRIILLKLF